MNDLKLIDSYCVVIANIKSEKYFIISNLFCIFAVIKLKIE
jgi:hypothetical protein